MATEAESPTAMTGVRVKNVGDETYTDMYNNQRYTIEPGSESFVPFDAAVLWLGDPRTQNIDDRNQHRNAEFQRVSFRFGVGDDSAQFDDLRPKLEVYSLEGERFLMVADDPTGPGQDVFKSGDKDLSAEGRIAALERVILEMQTGNKVDGSDNVEAALAELGIGDGGSSVPSGSSVPKGSSVPASTGLPPEDKPGKPAVSK